jgi:hypothetical protein
MIKWIQMQIIWICLFTASCSNTSNELFITGGAAAGAVCGHAIDKKSPWATVGGAAGGVLLTSAIMAKDKKSVQQGFDVGYIQGASDAIKRHYWMNQELHKSPSCNEKRVYLSIPEPTVTADGRNLVPHNVMIPIVE